MIEDGSPKPKRKRRGTLATFNQYNKLIDERLANVSTIDRDTCRKCGRKMRSREMNHHMGTVRCDAYAMLRRMDVLGRGPAPKTALGLIKRVGLAHEVGPSLNTEALTAEAVYVREDVAGLCRVLKGRMLEWAVNAVLGDEEFRDALATIRLIDDRPIAIVQFVEPEYAIRTVPRRRRR